MYEKKTKKNVPIQNHKWDLCGRKSALLSGLFGAYSIEPLVSKPSSRHCQQVGSCFISSGLELVAPGDKPYLLKTKAADKQPFVENSWKLNL